MPAMHWNTPDNDSVTLPIDAWTARCVAMAFEVRYRSLYTKKREAATYAFRAILGDLSAVVVVVQIVARDKGHVTSVEAYTVQRVATLRGAPLP